MSATITVRGTARDSRLPDRAGVTLSVTKQGRDWGSVHVTVTQALAGLNAAIAQLKADQPQAVVESAAAQFNQRSWMQDNQPIYSETGTVYLVFVDFPVMSKWLFAQLSDTVQLGYIDWQLSPAVRDQLRRDLVAQAVGEARARAEAFAAAEGLHIVSVIGLADPGLIGKTGSGNAAFADASPMMALGRGVRGGGGEVELEPRQIDTESQVEAQFLAE